ncbi:MAG: cell envelope integrity EipB family protein [Beijerinckiaceae bacterium]
MLENKEIMRWMRYGAAVVAMGAGPALQTGGVLAAGPAVAPPAVTQPAAMPEALPLAAHRAAYRVNLFQSTGTKSPTSANGRVSYEFSGSPCEGYTQSFRQITELQPAEGATRLSDMHSATFEDGEAHSFAFNVTNSTDNGGTGVIDGRAVKQATALAIQISKPARETIDVDQQVLFPTEHLKHIIAAARAGQKLFGAKVFDGSDDGKKVYDTMAIIGRPIEGPADDHGVNAALLGNVRRWPVSISYYEEDKKDEGPAYTLGFELYENGISRALRFDYGDFILAGELTALDLLPSKSCAK